ncbi:hypothetical protein FSP39_010785 [Pinctada imbricata]|uniref:ubiquitinyl hydrolase 1 n=1 Tax=Pinctada imbricata TaxID=66713 RepID=A0AA89BKC3_PINIB|nr:hypothetical protein FSP39_010785 [Pinctada imbricata]
MASCGGVCKWLVEFLSKQKGKKQDCLAETLDRCMRVLNNEIETDEDVYSPVDIIGGLRNRRWYISAEEQDAHEMFHVITQTLDEETAKYPGVVSLFDADSIQGTDHQVNENAITRTLSPLPALPHREMEHPFRGLLASQLECIKCQYRNPVRYDHFDSLSLSFPQKLWGTKSLEDLMLHYISAETVSNVECPGCGKVKQRSKETARMPLPRSTFKKQLTIGKLPQCLCIHIQRTTWLDNGLPFKTSDFISFPEILHMDDYVYCRNTTNKASRNGLVGGKHQPFFRPASGNLFNTGSSAPVNLLRTLNYDQRTSHSGLFLQQNQIPNLHSDVNHNGPEHTHSELTYKLSTVVVHQGDVMSGHFITYRKSPKTVKKERIRDKWLCCSDHNVRHVTVEEVLSSQAYMLIYERQ